MTLSSRQVLLSWSGGKDAAWTLHLLKQDPAVRVVGLLTTFTEGHERASMQGVRRDVIRAQADAAGLPLIESMIPQDCDNARYEAAFADGLAQAAARWPGLSTMAYGDLLLADVRDWRQALCARLGWDALFPLFGMDTTRVAGDMIAAGMRTHLCCVDTTLLDAGFAGRLFDAALLDALPEGVDPCGENGEFHTCVSAGPMFASPLPLQRGDTVLRDSRFAYTDFTLTEPAPPL
ncbi:Dph6-related ATP pyrophosphatase [Luteimonas qiangzhengi]|uniref:Dph6-related ATP pyrophosphatase n=1 Tax=Luteimonas sp. MJ146 TaxID=3129240 RepID=UPI0031BBBCFE